MATVITDECINCGACEPECPNTAIYQGGVEWELNGVTHPAISNDIFYIVPEKCTECVGFFDHEACAAVCPVDCCVPDPKIPETEEQLIARAQQLHPEVTFTADFPSRFRKDGAAAAAAPAAAAPPLPDVPAAAAAAAPAPAGSAAPKPAPAAAAAPSKAAAAPAKAAGRVEKAVKAPAAPKAPAVAKHFPGELPDEFDDIVERLRRARSGGAGLAARLVGPLLLPVLGALPHASKKRLEEAAGDRAVFSAAGATALNVILNFFLYPVLLGVVGAVVMHRQVFSLHFDALIFWGVVIAGIETMWRLREGLFGGIPTEDMVLGPALYGPLLLPLAAPLARGTSRTRDSGTIAFDGFYDGQFDEKRDRQRRYGEVYKLEDVGGGYLLRLEFPQRVPPSSVKEELGIPDEMPDYEYELALTNGSFVVRGKVGDPQVRKVASGAPSFPPDFTTRIALASPVRGFKHRYRDKTLEVVLVK
jgi:ferredoxin